VSKLIGLMNELLPEAACFAVLVNPTSPNAAFLTKEAQTAAAAIGRKVEVVTASNNREIEAVFTRIAQQRIDGLVVPGNTLFENRRVQLVTLAAHHRLPAIYGFRAFAEIGGLMSYGPNFAAYDRILGIYAGRILKGEKPADLPVEQATRFEFVINTQTTRALGLTVPPTLLALADEVIE
jgi:putative ABC transport system substrate-binding protein